MQEKIELLSRIAVKHAGFYTPSSALSSNKCH